MAKETYFVVGGEYRNHKGEYEVLQIQGSKMKVRYENGEEQLLDVEMQKRIIENMDRKETSSPKKQDKKEGFINYRLSLQDSHPSIDLTNEISAIKGVINDILQGGPTGTAFKNVASIEIVSVKKDSIIISVNESGTIWHAWVGKKLAKDYGKRYLCLSANPEKMFNWERI